MADLKPPLDSTPRRPGDMSEGSHSWLPRTPPARGCHVFQGCSGGTLPQGIGTWQSFPVASGLKFSIGHSPSLCGLAWEERGTGHLRHLQPEVSLSLPRPLFCPLFLVITTSGHQVAAACHLASPDPTANLQIGPPKNPPTFVLMGA